MNYVFLLASIIAAGSAFATPRVVTDIAPVHSLAARVMAGVGAPELLLPPGTSPHGYAMRPSQARAVQAADLVVWVGPALTPWLERPLATLSGHEILTLSEAPGTLHLAARRSAAFEAHHHDADASEHGETSHSEEDARAHSHEDHHDHGPDDPHMWLSPQNAAAWLDAIASELSERDPDNAERYRRNAVDGMAELEALDNRLNAQLAAVRGRPFIVSHDAYQYFEDHFGISAAGSISLGDAQKPSAQRVAALRDRIATDNIVCVFSEPQINDGLVKTVVEGTAAQRGVLDPIGADIDLGAEFYTSLLTGMADNLTDCLAAN